MSNAGRKKLPREVKEARGTLEKSRELPEERAMKPLKVTKEDMSIPDFLNEYGKTFYKHYYIKLTDLEILTETDIETLSLMSAEYGRYIECQYHIKKFGLVSSGTNKNGSEYEMVSPYRSHFLT